MKSFHNSPWNILNLLCIMGNPALSFVVVVLLTVRIFSAAISGLLEYNYVFLLSYNLAAPTRRKRFVWNQSRQVGGCSSNIPLLADSSVTLESIKRHSRKCLPERNAALAQIQFFHQRNQPLLAGVFYLGLFLFTVLSQ